MHDCECMRMLSAQMRTDNTSVCTSASPALEEGVPLWSCRNEEGGVGVTLSASDPNTGSWGGGGGADEG